MTALLLLLAIVVLVGLAAWIRQRRHSAELSSISDYRHALSTLAAMQHTSADHHLKVFGEGEAAPTHSSGIAAPRLDEHLDSGRLVIGADGEPIYVFDEVRPPPLVERRTTERGRESQWALEHMTGGFGRRRPLGLFIAGGAIALFVIVGAVIESRQPTPAPVTIPTTSTSTTTTTLPPAAAPLSQGPGVATYATVGTNYTVTVTPASPCWVQVEGLTSKTTPYAETVNGQTKKVLTLNEPATVSLGSPTGAVVLLDGVPLQLPTAGSPTILTFTVPGTTTTTTTSTTLPSNVLTGSGA
jgi:hypothetical protein